MTRGKPAKTARTPRPRRALQLPVKVRWQDREPPSIIGARLILALQRGECDPTCGGVAEYLRVYRSTAFRLLSRLVEAGILTRRKERRDRIPPLWVYAVADKVEPQGET